MKVRFVSVMKRRSETGIRRAVGAIELAVCIFFLAKAWFLSLIGGILGVSLGGLIVYGIACHWRQTVTKLDPIVI